jgi:hypothetical protein
MVASLPKVLPVNLTNSKDGNPVISTRAPKT